MPAPPPPAGQSFAPGLNPLGLFSIQSGGGSTTAINSQQFNPGDVPAPPQYGSGAGAPTNYTQTNFGGSAAPNMAAGLNTAHNYVSVANTPPPATPPPISSPAPRAPYIAPSLNGPKSPYAPSPVRLGSVLSDDPTANRNLYTEPDGTSLIDNARSLLRSWRAAGSPHNGAPPPTNTSTATGGAKAAAVTPNAALSTSSMRVPTSTLSFNRRGPNL